MDKKTAFDYTIHYISRQEERKKNRSQNHLKKNLIQEKNFIYRIFSILILLTIMLMASLLPKKKKFVKKENAYAYISLPKRKKLINNTLQEMVINDVIEYIDNIGKKTLAYVEPSTKMLLYSKINLNSFWSICIVFLKVLSHLNKKDQLSFEVAHSALRFIIYIYVNYFSISKQNIKSAFFIAEYGCFQASFIACCKILKVDVFAFQHGIIRDTHTGYIFEKNSYGSYKGLLPDRLLVWSDFEVKKLIKLGWNRDKLFNLRIYSKSFEKQISFPKIKTIEFISQAHGIKLDLIIEICEKIVKSNKINDLKLNYKAHPNEPTTVSKLIKSKFHNKIKISNYDGFKKDTLYLTIASSRGFEAIMHGNRCLQIDTNGLWGKLIDDTDIAGFHYTKKLFSLDKVINKIVNKEERYSSGSTIINHKNGILNSINLLL
jgi:hypothetical protein